LLEEVEGLKNELSAMTRERNFLQETLDRKNEEFDELERRHEEKCSEFDQERKAHLL